MRFALAAVGFRNGDLQHNKNVIIRTLTECAGRADVALFGEALLQGIYAAAFDPAQDSAVAVSFRFIEKAGNFFYSSQMTINSAGEILDVCRRISPAGRKNMRATDTGRAVASTPSPSAASRSPSRCAGTYGTKKTSDRCSSRLPMHGIPPKSTNTPCRPERPARRRSTFKSDRSEITWKSDSCPIRAKQKPPPT